MVPAIATEIELQWQVYPERSRRAIPFISGILIGLLLWSSCNSQPKNPVIQQKENTAAINDSFINKLKVTHVFVALCDNKFQGIQPVPKAIGNGKDPDQNLYWGCDYGLRAYFKKYTEWKLVKTIKKPSTNILERCIFKHAIFNNYLVADAYDGEFIKQCTIDFLDACAGKQQQKLVVNKDTIGIGGNAQLLAYIGHDGLMDFKLDSFPKQANKNKREAIILACMSKQYFTDIIKRTGAKPLLWTTQLMCPEAYTLDAALTGWLNKETDKQIHQRASAAYSKYQKCSVKAAGGLLATGY
jgi:hypothetical protein